MKYTLKQLVDLQALTGEQDIDIIYNWFVKNDAEEIGIDLVTQLSKSKINKLQNVLDGARAWIPNMMRPYPKQPKNARKTRYYDEETERRLTQLVQYNILQMELPKTLLDWAREHIPQMEEPFCFYWLTTRWLKDQYGIEFKGRDTNEDM